MERILPLEISLLLLRHGRRQVLDALAAAGEKTVEEVERELVAAKERKANRKVQPKPLSEIVAEACQERPEISDSLRSLAIRFENRTFLPQLRDVEHFLERTGSLRGKLKSRRTAGTQVFAALSRLGAEDLRRLVGHPDTEGEDDYVLLAREIMDGGKEQRRESAPTVADKETQRTH